jgi:hypothetical protein
VRRSLPSSTNAKGTFIILICQDFLEEQDRNRPESAQILSEAGVQLTGKVSSVGRRFQGTSDSSAQRKPFSATCTSSHI